MSNKPSVGLGDVEAVESSITAITPEGLFLRGIALDSLIEHATFEELVFLLWHDRRPTAAELDDLRAHYRASWALPKVVTATLQLLPSTLDPLSALQVSLPLLALEDHHRDAHSPHTQQQRATGLLAQVTAVLACWRRHTPAAPLDAGAPLARQILQALGAKELPPRVADAALILYADHELAASTFAARITAAAQSDFNDGLGAGLAVLKGPLHGGSTVEAARLLRHLVAQPDQTQAIQAALAVRGRIPGFGHSVYRQGDPRASQFRRLAEQIATGAEQRWLDVALELEARVLRERGMYANVDLYGAVFMHTAGFADDAMITLFAAARTAGWLAHILEQRHNNRLIRPRARYTGSLGRAWNDL